MTEEPDSFDTQKMSTPWKIRWILLIVVAGVLSLRTAYIAPLVLPVLYSCAQSISIAFVPNSRNPFLWLIHIPYWLLILCFGVTEEVILFGLFGSSILGELLIHKVVKNALEWKWLLYNTCAMIVLFVGYYFLSALKPSYFNEFTMMVAIALVFGLSALVSSLGIELYIDDVGNEKRPSPEGNDL